MIKAIETKYKGYRFRSRTEARWAVFFDAMGWEWEYEKEGYYFDGTYYLPDFWLPKEKTFAEVKGGEFTKKESEKCRMLSKLSGFKCLQLDGVPARKPYWMWEQENFDGARSFFIGRYKDNWSGFWWTAFDGTLQINNPEFMREIEYCTKGRIEESVNAALGARFEHGETGVSL